MTLGGAASCAGRARAHDTLFAVVRHNNLIVGILTNAIRAASPQDAKKRPARGETAKQRKLAAAARVQRERDGGSMAAKLSPGQGRQDAAGNERRSPGPQTMPSLMSGDDRPRLRPLELPPAARNAPWVAKFPAVGGGSVRIVNNVNDKGIMDTLLDERSFVALHNRMMQHALPSAVDSITPDCVILVMQALGVRASRPHAQRGTWLAIDQYGRATARSHAEGRGLSRVCARVATAFLSHSCRLIRGPPV